MNYSLSFWHSSGLDKKKIVVGLPTYGHSFKWVKKEDKRAFVEIIYNPFIYFSSIQQTCKSIQPWNRCTIIWLWKCWEAWICLVQWSVLVQTEQYLCEYCLWFRNLLTISTFSKRMDFFRKPAKSCVQDQVYPGPRIWWGYVVLLEHRWLWNALQ